MELRNVCSIFMIPTLGISREDLKNNGFINAYIQDIQKEVNYEDSVYLLYKPPNLIKFKNFLDNEYERTPALIEDYDYPKNLVVTVYKLDERFKRDFELIKVGKYSQTSDEFKELFPKLLRKLDKKGYGEEETSVQWRIFNKSPDIVDFWEKRIGVSFNDKMEVWPTFDKEKETLDINKIKNG